MSALALAAAAEALADTPFRLHGRDPATGLDCVGVLAAALKAIGRQAPLPHAYRLRSRAIPRLAEIARRCGLEPAKSAIEAGNVVLARIGSCQFHVLIAARDGRFVHAHAGLRRVVIGPLPPDWTIFGHWCLAASD